MGKSSKHGPFSKAMLNSQMVYTSIQDVFQHLERKNCQIRHGFTAKPLPNRNPSICCPLCWQCAAKAGTQGDRENQVVV